MDATEQAGTLCRTRLLHSSSNLFYPADRSWGIGTEFGMEVGDQLGKDRPIRRLCATMHTGLIRAGATDRDLSIQMIDEAQLALPPRNYLIGLWVDREEVNAS